MAHLAKLAPLGVLLICAPGCLAVPGPTGPSPSPIAPPPPAAVESGRPGAAIVPGDGASSRLPSRVDAAVGRADRATPAGAGPDPSGVSTVAFVLPEDVGAGAPDGPDIPAAIAASDRGPFMGPALTTIPGVRDAAVSRVQDTSPPGPDAATSAPSASGPGPGSAAAGDGAGGAGGAAPRGDGGGISGNPAAVNILVGSGRLGEILGVNRDGFRFGGLNITDNSGILAGGLGPGKWAVGSLTIADLSLNLEERFGWKGGLVGTQFLNFSSGSPGYTINGVEQGKHSPNALAGTVMGFESLSVVAPFNRSELYQLWYRQTFADDKFIVRIGKSVPTYDFDNVVKSVPMGDAAGNISAVSSALLTPLYVNPTMLGVIPGYYNSSTGVVGTFAPNKQIYAQYGFFDGNLARGAQLGRDGPHFNGYWLHLAEVGGNWTIGEEKKPGKFGVGGWFQTGRFTSFSDQPINGAQGFYFFGSQRLTYRDRKKNNNGLSAYYQFGTTGSDIVFVHRYFGCGLTYIGPIPSRPEDSMGFAFALGEMTRNPGAGAAFFPPPTDAILRSTQLGQSESILTWYYQMKLFDGAYFQPNLTYIPDPAIHEGIPSALALTLRVILLF